MGVLIFLIVLALNTDKLSKNEKRCCERLVQAEVKEDYRGLISYSVLCAYLENHPGPLRP